MNDELSSSPSRTRCRWWAGVRRGGAMTGDLMLVLLIPAIAIALEVCGRGSVSIGARS